MTRARHSQQTQAQSNQSGNKRTDAFQTPSNRATRVSERVTEKQIIAQKNGYVATRNLISCNNPRSSNQLIELDFARVDNGKSDTKCDTSDFPCAMAYGLTRKFCLGEGTHPSPLHAVTCHQYLCPRTSPFSLNCEG